MDPEFQEIHRALQSLARRMDALEARARRDGAGHDDRRGEAAAGPVLPGTPAASRAGGPAARAGAPRSEVEMPGEPAPRQAGPGREARATSAGGGAGSPPPSGAGSRAPGGMAPGAPHAPLARNAAEELRDLMQAGFAALEAAEDLKAVPRFFARFAHENGLRMLLLKRWNSGLEVLLAEGLSKSRQMATEDPASERIAIKDDDLFAALAQDHCVYAGPIPARHFPLELSLLLGRGPERHMVLLPLPLRGRWNTFLFLDAPAERADLLAVTEALARHALGRLMLLEHGERTRPQRCAAILAQELARRGGDQPAAAAAATRPARRAAPVREQAAVPSGEPLAEAPIAKTARPAEASAAPPAAPAGAAPSAGPAGAPVRATTPAEANASAEARGPVPSAAPSVSGRATPLTRFGEGRPGPAPGSSGPGTAPSPAAPAAAAPRTAGPSPAARAAGLSRGGSPARHAAADDPGLDPIAQPLASPAAAGLGVEEAFPLTRFPRANLRPESAAHAPARAAPARAAPSMGGPAAPAPRPGAEAARRERTDPGEGPLGSTADLDRIFADVMEPAAGRTAPAAPSANGPFRSATAVAEEVPSGSDTGAGAGPQMDLQKFLAKAGELPALPRVANHILALIADPNTTAAKLEKAIILDQALTAKVLRIANSSFYGGLRDVNTVSEAIVRLGFVTIRNWTLVTAAKAVFVDAQTAPALQQVWQQSVLSAMASQLVAERVHFRAPEAVFVGGLMQNIGQLALAKAAPDQFRQVMEASAEAQVPYHVVERELLGFDHGDLGAMLIREWNLSDELEAAVRQHHHLEDAEGPARRLAAMIALGEEIAFCSGSVPDEELTIWEMSTAAKILDVDEPTYVDLLERARQLRIDPRLFG